MNKPLQTLPEKMWPGKGTACLINGLVVEEKLLKTVNVRTDTEVTSSTLLRFAMNQLDECCQQQNSRICLLSGFTSLLRFPSVSKSINMNLELRAEFRGKHTKVIDHRMLELVPESTIRSSGSLFRHTDEGNKVVICMASWEPDPVRFKRQIESIKKQTHKSWHCIINDDASSDESWQSVRDIVGDDSRFSLYRNEENLGFYANFERALSRVPVDTDFVALADQDDDWYPEKIEASLQGFDKDTVLVYCDMRIVDENSDVIAETYWDGRRNNFRDADVLFLANTVTGAASVFRRNLLDDILPFPQPVGQVFHDHWIACVARCRGSLGYVDQALYDYYQYSSSVIGHCDFEARGIVQRVADTAGMIRHFGKLNRFKSWLVKKRMSALNIFHFEYLRLYLFAEILKIRLPDMQHDAARALRMFSAGWLAIFYLLISHLRIVLRKETTDDAELRLAGSLFIFKLDRLLGHLFAGRIVKKHCQSLNRSAVR